VGAFAPIRDFVETLVHPSAQQDPLTAARHRSFIAPRLIGGILALGAFPFYLVGRGATSSAELIVFGWPAVPILSAYYLSRTGDYESAHVVSAAALTGFALFVAAWTGGLGSFAAIWFVVGPIEAALSGCRRAVAAASIMALAAAAVSVLLGAAHLLPVISGQEWETAAAFGVAFAVVYAVALAVSAEALARAGSSLREAEDDRYRLLARATTEVVTRHGSDGDVLFASPAAESLFGAPVAALHGRGLLQRVHVADRPAYLMALGDAAALSENRATQFRARRDGCPDESRDAAPFVWIEMQCRPLSEIAETPRGQGGREVVALLRELRQPRHEAEPVEQIAAELEHAQMPMRKSA
jgi:two-component system, cell cycle sensor histidine kinase DivJ